MADNSLNKNFNLFLFYLFSFVLLVGVPVPLSSNLVLNSLDVYAYFLLFFFFLAFLRAPKSKVLVVVVIFGLTYSIYTLFMSSLGRDFNFEGINAYFVYCVVGVGAYVYAFLLNRLFHRNSFFTFLSICFYSSLVHALIVLLIYLYPPLDGFLRGFIYRSPAVDTYLSGRIAGLNASGGDGMSMNLALLSLVGSGLAVFFKDDKVKFFLIFSCSVFSISVTVLSARTGLFIGLPLVFMWFFIISSPKARLFYITAFISIFVFFLGSLSYLVDLSFHMVDLYGYNHSLSRFFEVFRNYSRTGGFSYKTGSSLLNMLFIPDDVVRFIIGNGVFGRGEYENIGSDVGFVRSLHAVGIVGVAIHLAVFSYLMYKIRAIVLNGLNNPNLVFLLLLLVVFFLFFGNFKIMYLHARIPLFIFFSLYFTVFIQSKNGLRHHKAFVTPRIL